MDSYIIKHWIVIALALVGCPADDTGSANTDAASDGECTPGTEACACIEGGQCVTGLVCASNLCVDIDGTGSGDESGVKPEESSSSGNEETGMPPAGSCVGNCGGSDQSGDAWCYCSPSCMLADDCCSDYESACPGGCLFNGDCDASDVCTGGQECIPAFDHVYELTVKSWRDYTPDCWDSFAGDCLADVFFTVFYGTQGEVCRSTVHDETSDTEWIDEPCDVAINETDVMQIVFYDFDDVTANDPTNSVCFNTGGECGAIGIEYLRAGGAIWDFSSDPAADDRFYVEIGLVAK